MEHRNKETGSLDMTAPAVEKTEWQEAVELVSRHIQCLKGRPTPIYDFITRIEMQQARVSGDLALGATLHLIDSGRLEYNAQTYELGALNDTV